MSLVFDDVFGNHIDRVQTAIMRLREFQPDEGYYGADSGGKDSCVIVDLCKRGGIKVDWHMHLTTVDPPEVVWFLREHHPDTRIERPAKTMRQLVVAHSLPPTRIVRYCCSDLKEIGGKGRTVITGVRAAESARRAKTRRLVEYHKQQTVVNPILDWSDADVWQYIRTYNVPYCKLYDEGQKRIGCVMCPMKNTKGMTADALRWPKIAAVWRKACDEAFVRRSERMDQRSWTSGADMYDWWINGQPADTEDEAQCVLIFED